MWSQLDKDTKKEFLFVLLLVFFVSLLFVVEYSHATEVCFTEEGTNRLVVELEQCQNLKEQINLFTQKSVEEERQIQLLKEKGSLQDRQLKTCNDTIEKWKGTVEEQKRICNDQKPGFFNQLFKALGFVGIGVLVGVIL